MTTYCAVVKYPVQATDKEKLQALREGLQYVVIEMVDLGCTAEQVESALEEAQWAADDEARAIAESPK